MPQEARCLKERKRCCFGQWVRPGFGFEKLEKGVGDGDLKAPVQPLLKRSAIGGAVAHYNISKAPTLGHDPQALLDMGGWWMACSLG